MDAFKLFTGGAGANCKPVCIQSFELLRKNLCIQKDNNYSFTNVLLLKVNIIGYCTICIRKC